MVPLSSELSAEYARHGIKLPKEPETGVLIVDVLLSLHIHHRIYISHSPSPPPLFFSLQVIPGGPVAQAGIQPDDVIIKVNDQPIKAVRDVHSPSYLRRISLTFSPRMVTQTGASSARRTRQIGLHHCTERRQADDEGSNT